jgi:hypothetical protein
MLAVAGATAALAMIITTPASALYVRPFKAPLVDASGATNGCEAKVAEMTISPVHRAIRANLRITCPEAASVRRISSTWGVWEVLADGSLREVDPYVLKARATSLTPIVGVTRVEMGVALCALPENAGAHTWLIRARVGVKTTGDNSDPNPFDAKVDRQQTVTC